MKSSKGGTQVKQNKGIMVHEFSDKHTTGKSIKPTAGSKAVEIRGTHVHAAQREGITRPSEKNAGSHDHLIREHADHKD